MLVHGVKQGEDPWNLLTSQPRVLDECKPVRDAGSNRKKDGSGQVKGSWGMASEADLWLSHVPPHTRTHANIQSHASTIVTGSP